MTSTVQTETSVARKRRTSAKKSMTPTVELRSSKPSRASGASGHNHGVSQEHVATRKVARKGRTAAFEAPIAICDAPQSKVSRKGAGGHKGQVYQCATATGNNSALQPNPDTHVDSERASSTPDVAADRSTRPNNAMPQHRDTIIALNETWRLRQGMVKAMTKLSLQAQASLREGRSKEDAAKHYALVAKDMTHEDYPAIMPYLLAQKPLAESRAAYEKDLVRHVKTLPIYQWAKRVSGLGEVSLAGIIGECSGFNVETNEWWSIGDMKSVSAVWKRMGLAVINGGRQRRVTGEEALEHGYVAPRRAVMWNVGECLVKAQWRKENTVHAYGKMYGELKARMQERNEAGEFSDTALEIAARMRKAGKPLAENLAGRLTPSHINNRAKRHMTKRLLRDLYVEWHRLESPLNTAPKLA